MSNHLNDKDVADLRYIFISRFDIDITEDQARDYGYWLLEAVKLMFPDEYVPFELDNHVARIK